ncbi:MAG TPA: hypothetical protein VH417_13325 [Vicinamibacterales bacterium]|jgi:hypothetical protein
MFAANTSAPVTAGSPAVVVSLVSSLLLTLGLLLTIGSLPLPLLIKPITG